MTTELQRPTPRTPGLRPGRPAVRRAPRASAGWGPRLVVLGLVLACFSGNWRVIGVPGPLDRVLLAAGLGICAVNFVARGGRIRLRPVHVLLALALTWATVSAVSAPGGLGGARFYALVDRFGIIPFALFVLAPAVFGTPASRRLLARAFTVLGAYLALTSLAHMFGATALVWPSYISDPSVGIHLSRARGPYVEAVANGLMLTMSAALAGITAARDTSRRWRFVGAIVVPLCLVGVLLTLTRAIWVGALLALVASAVAVPRLRRWSVPLGAVVAAGAGLAYVAIPGLADLVTQRGGSELPVWDRFNTNWAAVRMLLDHPLTGVGWHESAANMLHYVRQGPTYPVTSASGEIEVHNVFLSRLAELGVVGAALWCAALVAATVHPLLRRPELPDLAPWRAALLPILIVWTVAAMFGPMPYPQPNYVLWCVGGIALLGYTARPESDVRPRGPRVRTLVRPT